MRRVTSRSCLIVSALILAGLALTPAPSSATNYCGISACAVKGDPAADLNPVFTTHEFTATVTTNGAALQGTTVFFEVTSGPNTGVSGDGITDASGQVQFFYTDTMGLSATDTIVICADFDGDDTTSGGGTFDDCVNDSNDRFIEITKTWTWNYVTGGGKVGDKKSTYTFGGTFGPNPDPNGPDTIGQWEINKQFKTKAACHFDTFYDLALGGPPTTSPPSNHSTARVMIAGTCNPGGTAVAGTLYVEDNAEPGKGSDFINYTCSVGCGTLPDFGGLLVGGNLQMHQVFAP